MQTRSTNGVVASCGTRLLHFLVFGLYPIVSINNRSIFGLNERRFQISCGTEGYPSRERFCGWITCQALIRVVSGEAQKRVAVPRVR